MAALWPSIWALFAGPANGSGRLRVGCEGRLSLHKLIGVGPRGVDHGQRVLEPPRGLVVCNFDLDWLKASAHIERNQFALYTS